MPFTFLLLTGLAPDRQVNEEGVSVAIRHDKNDNDQNNETFLLFSLDKCKEFRNEFLKNSKTNDATRCCDAICFYAEVVENQKTKIIICFIELKAGGDYKDISKAVTQITNTYEGVKKGIEEIHNISTQKLEIAWKSLIVTKSALLNDAHLF